MTSVDPARIAVLGAGPAGLIAALEAAEAGHAVTIFEAENRVGGMAGSLEVAGQRVDLGSHRLHPETPPDVMERISGLLGADLQVRQRNGRIRLRERWVGFPLRPVDAARSLPADFAMRTAFDAFAGPLRRSSDGSFAGELVRRLGPTIFDEFYDPYARKLYGTDPRALDAELAHRRVAASSPLAIARRAVRASRVDGRQFFYPRLGYGQIAEALADAAVSAGADLRLAARVDGLQHSGDVWRVTAGGSTSDADLVLSTIPTPAALRAMSDAPAAVVDAARRLRTRAMVLVYLVVPRSQYTSFDAHYFPGLDLATARLSEPKNYRDGDDPPGRTVLCAEVACWREDEIWNDPAASLGERVRADLVRAGLPDPTPEQVDVVRLPNVYPVYERDTRDARAVVDSWAGGLDRFLIFGRQGLGVPDNLHHVLRMGIDAAAVVRPRGEVDAPRWRRNRAAYADHVVQD